MRNLRLWATCVVAIFASTLLQAKARTAHRGPAQTSQASLNRIWTAENQRTLKDPYLATAIHHSSPTIRQAAIWAIARIGDPSLLMELSGELNRRRAPNKEDVAFALGLIPDETAVTMAVQHLAMQQDPKVLRQLYLSIGRAGGEKHLAVLAEGLRGRADPTVLSGICLAVGSLWAKDSENWAVPRGIISLLLQRSKQSDELALNCGFALSRFKGLPSFYPPDETLRTSDQVKSIDAGNFFLRILGKIQTPASTSLLAHKFATAISTSTRTEAIKALGQQTWSKNVSASLRSALESPQSHILVPTLEATASYKVEAKELSPAVMAVYKKNKSPWVRGHCLYAGMAIDAEQWTPFALKEISDPKSDIRASAAGAIALAARPEEAPLIATLLKDPNPTLIIEMLDKLVQWGQEDFTPEIKNSLRLLLDRKEPGPLALVAALSEQGHWTDFISPLSVTYSNLAKTDWVEAKNAVLSALSSLGATPPIPSSEVRSGQTPFTAEEVQKAVRSHVVLKTNRGEIRLRMLAEAPLNSLNFVRLVRNGFYNNSEFHRVVPGFVAQGGDPTHHGFGGPGYLVRDEISFWQNKRGTVGLASSGKDTGGSQFYFNLAPNFHLDGRFTVFAEVTQGLNVVDTLEVGDKILSAVWVPQ